MKTRNSIKNLKTIKEVAEELDYTDEDKRQIVAYKFLYDLIYTLEDVRRKKGITQEKLSQKSGVPRPEVSKILNGEVKRVSVERLFKIASALDMELVLKQI